MDRSRILVPAALLLVVAACGKSRQEEAFEQIERECYALVEQGATYRDAVIQLQPQGDETDCFQHWSSLESNNTCMPWTQENPQCRVLLLWVPTDSGLCQAGRGCCLACELRVMGDELAASGIDAPICATTFRRGLTIPGVC
jgi:hypothetical protein